MTFSLNLIKKLHMTTATDLRHHANRNNLILDAKIKIK